MSPAKVQSYPKSHGDVKQPTHQTDQEENQLQNSAYASDITAWVHISITSESAPTLCACYAASANPWKETIWDNVPH
jgi:hypothetical protein